MEDLISVVVPIYRKEKYLSKCIESVVNQTYKNIELILVDDGSPDSCPHICDKYAEKDKRLKVFHNKNAGVSSARNYGMKNSRGTYLMFVDADDYIEEDCIEKLYSSLKNNDTDMSLGNIKRIEGENEYILQDFSPVIEHNNVIDVSRREGREGYDLLKKINEKEYPCILTPIVCKLFKARIINQKQIFFPNNVKTAEDQVFFYDYMQYIDTISFVDSPLYFYQDSDSSVCKNGIGDYINKNQLFLLEIFIKMQENSTNVFHRKMCQDFIKKLYRLFLMKAYKGFHAKDLENAHYLQRYLRKHLVSILNVLDFKDKLYALLFAISANLFYQAHAIMKNMK